MIRFSRSKRLSGVFCTSLSIRWLISSLISGSASRRLTLFSRSRFSRFSSS